MKGSTNDAALGAPPWRGGDSLMRWGGVTGVVGLIAWVIGAFFNSRQALFSYLTAYMFVVSIGLGGLILLMSVHAARSEWPIVVRRLIEHISGVLPLMVVLFVPIAIGVRHIYPWAGAELVTEAIKHKAPYLNVSFFILRAVFYFFAWLLLSYLLRTWSLRQDDDGDATWNIKQWRLSGIGLVIVALTLTGASVDWTMSLTPEWDSSVYGVYIFAGGFVSAFALLAMLMRGAQAQGLAVNHAHFLSTGKYMFAFVIFWAYNAFAQYFIIWIADLPEEVTWWLPRSEGWAPVSIALATIHFIVPFFVLLSRGLKMVPRRLTTVSLWLLVAHYLDMYWLVMPALHKDQPHFHWLDLAALLFVGGVSLLFATWRARGLALFPTKDPRLPASIAYEGS